MNTCSIYMPLLCAGADNLGTPCELWSGLLKVYVCDLKAVLK